MMQITLKYIGTYYGSTIVLYLDYNSLYDSDEIVILSDYTCDGLDFKSYYNIKEIF